MRFFNTAGPVQWDRHYCLPPLQRFNLADVLSLIDQQKYFVLHAPRQTGKTSALLALMTYLNQGDKYACLYFNVEVGQYAREDVRQGTEAILNELTGRARDMLGDLSPQQIWAEIYERFNGGTALNELLTRGAGDTTDPS